MVLVAQLVTVNIANDWCGLVGKSCVPCVPFHCWRRATAHALFGFGASVQAILLWCRGRVFECSNFMLVRLFGWVGNPFPPVIGVRGFYLSWKGWLLLYHFLARKFAPGEPIHLPFRRRAFARITAHSLHVI